MRDMKLKQVLQPEYERIALEIANRIPSSDGKNCIFAFVPVSLFIDPKKQASAVARSICFYCCVPFLIGTEDQSFVPRIAILISEDPDAERTRKVLEDNGFPYVILSLHDHRERIRDALEAALSANAYDANAGRKFGSMEQLLFSRYLLADFGELVRDGWIAIFEEIALRAAVDMVPWEVCSERRLSQTRVNEDSEDLTRLSDYGNKTSFDFLITYASPDYFPFLAIEYDGSSHLEPRKRDNDRRKERICELAGLPLVRVTSRFLAPPNAGSVDLRTLQKKQRADMISFLIVQFFIVAGAWRRLLQLRDAIPERYRQNDDGFVRSAMKDLSPNWELASEQSRESTMLAEEFSALTGRQLEITFERAAYGARSMATFFDRGGRSRSMETPWIDLKLTSHSLLNAEELLKEYGRIVILKLGIQIAKAQGL